MSALDDFSAQFELQGAKRDLNMALLQITGLKNMLRELHSLAQEEDFDAMRDKLQALFEDDK